MPERHIGLLRWRHAAISRSFVARCAGCQQGIREDIRVCPRENMRARGFDARRPCSDHRGRSCERLCFTFGFSRECPVFRRKRPDRSIACSQALWHSVDIYRGKSDLGNCRARQRRSGCRIRYESIAHLVFRHAQSPTGRHRTRIQPGLAQSTALHRQSSLGANAENRLWRRMRQHLGRMDTESDLGDKQQIAE